MKYNYDYLGRVYLFGKRKQTRKVSVEAGIRRNAIYYTKRLYINEWLSYSQLNYSISRPSFVRHLGICTQICVKLLQLMYAVITHNSVKKRSICINKWLSYRQLQCFTAIILSAIVEFIIGFVSNF